MSCRTLIIVAAAVARLFTIDCRLLSRTTAVVLWHGVGENCSDPGSMGGAKGILERNVPGIYVKVLVIGSDSHEDEFNAVWMDVNEQVRHACHHISKDERLRRGYHAIGFSQGAQFIRGVAQRCPEPPIFNLISIGGQQQGVYGVPQCNYDPPCDLIRRVINAFVYLPVIQSRLAQAQYWHDPLHPDLYRRRSRYLADINNEVVLNESYKNNLSKLKNFVLVKFNDDEEVTPRDSEWFGFYKHEDVSKMVELWDSRLYKEDRIGLKVLNETGRLHLLLSPGGHIEYTEKWFVTNIIEKYIL
ncbi:PPT1 (predicted) [Pycnogonum litorale]